MNLSLIATRTLGSTEFFLKRNAPHILTGAGVAGFIATVALTARATNQAVDELPKISQNIREVQKLREDKKLDKRYVDKEMARVFFDSSSRLLKIYGPVLAVGSASIVCIIAGHGMMAKRQASLLAAYSALDASFKAYRSRIAEKLGQEEEISLYRSVKTDDGWKSCDEACEIERIDKDSPLPSPYARFFDECSRNWTKTPEYNLMFLRSQQDWANDRLRAYGFIFLNEVYEALGLERSQAGQIVGWKLNGDGDGFVDFGLYAIGDDTNRAFVNIIEPTVMLDFNVDGIIRI